MSVVHPIPIRLVAMAHGFCKTSIAGREHNHKRKSGVNGGFVGLYTIEDLDGERKRLEHAINNYEPQNFPCPYNSRSGRPSCSPDCVTAFIDCMGCPEGILYEAQRKLSRVKM